ncbi:hypothetical protein PM082_023166 [Marasmius tenuissimus]|nr:hypothetical protein PM082_023166 [Marasmius tenuissimus]
MSAEDFNMANGANQQPPVVQTAGTNGDHQLQPGAQQRMPQGQQTPVQLPPPVVFPFPIDLCSLEGLPRGQDQDPTRNMTDAIPAVQLTHIEHTFSEGPFPLPMAAHFRLVYRVASLQVEEIECDPDNYAFAQFYGGGKRHRENYPDTEVDLENKINAWALGTVTVIRADSTVHSDKPFDGLSIAIVQIPKENTELKAFIMSRRVFSWAEGPHVLFHKVNPTAEAWPLIDMVSLQRLPSDQASLDRLLVHIKLILAFHPAMVAFVHQIAQNTGFLGTTTAERMAELMSTWYIVFIETTKLDTAASAYQLRGMPLNILTLTHRRLLSIIREHADDFYRLGLTHFCTRVPAFKPCLLCRSECHPSHGCPYPKIPGWFGPSLDTIRNWIREHTSIGFAAAWGHGRGGWGIRGRGNFGGHGGGNSRFDPTAPRNTRFTYNCYDALQ